MKIFFKILVCAVLSSQSISANAQQGTIPGWLSNYLMGRWYTESGCLNQKFERWGIFFERNNNQLTASRWFSKQTGDPEPSLLSKFTFVSGRTIDDREKVFEIRGIEEDFVNNRRGQIVQTIKVLNDYSRINIQYIVDGKLIIDRGILLSNGSPAPVLFKCNSTEMITKKEKILKQEEEVRKQEAIKKENEANRQKLNQM